MTRKYCNIILLLYTEESLKLMGYDRKDKQFLNCSLSDKSNES